jgi:glutamate-1-semialdehyde 2,1-aminomutase
VLPYSLWTTACHAYAPKKFDPRDSKALSHSGTFNNNTLGMHAGHTAMSQIFTPEVSVEFNALGEWLRAQLLAVTEGTRAFFTGVGTIMTVHFSDARTPGVARGDDISERSDLRDLFWMEMMEQGYWLTRRGSIALILGTPKEELERFVGCVKSFVQKYDDLMRIE